MTGMPALLAVSTGVAPEEAKHHGRQSHHRADGEINSPRDDDWCERKCEQSDFNAQPRHLECVRGRGEVVPHEREYHTLDTENDE